EPRVAHVRDVHEVPGPLTGEAVGRAPVGHRHLRHVARLGGRARTASHHRKRSHHQRSDESLHLLPLFPSGERSLLALSGRIKTPARPFSPPDRLARTVREKCCRLMSLELRMDDPTHTEVMAPRHRRNRLAVKTYPTRLRGNAIETPMIQNRRRFSAASSNSTSAWGSTPPDSGARRTIPTSATTATTRCCI